MKLWIVIGVPTAAALILAILTWRERRQARDEASYVQQIQSLKTDRPMNLPAVKPLVAKRHGKRRSTKPAPFRMRATGGGR